MKRDALVLPFDDNNELVIAADNSGSIGEKAADSVHVSYETVAYFAFRVAYMECVAAGGVPFAVVVQNFNGDQSWDYLVAGVKQGFAELGIIELPITGSTESNFGLSQSATGITVIGKRAIESEKAYKRVSQFALAVIGKPLAGQEVIEEEQAIAPLRLLNRLSEEGFVTEILPAGSKGIAHELKQLYPNQSFYTETELDLEKSAGPATCFVVVYDKTYDKHIRTMGGKFFYPITVITN